MNADPDSQPCREHWFLKAYFVKSFSNIFSDFHEKKLRSRKKSPQYIIFCGLFRIWVIIKFFFGSIILYPS